MCTSGQIRSGIARQNHVRSRFVSATPEGARESNNWLRTAAERERIMNNQWIVKNRREKLTVVIYSVIGLIVVTVLVTLANYALYSSSLHR